MTAEQIDAMPAGREMDALVAERVMGWVRHPDSMYRHWCERQPDGTLRFLDQCEPLHTVRPWHPSTDIAAAWEVVEKLRGESFPWEFSLGWRHIEPFVSFGRTANQKDEIGFSHGETAPLAICRAALKTVNA
jgi:hypothetical protein